MSSRTGSKGWILASGLAALMAVSAGPTIVRADDAGAGGDVQEQLQIMQQQMRRMQDELRRTKDELAATKASMSEPRAVAPAPAGLDLPGFFERLEFGGWVSGSYFYNFNEPDGGFLGGANAGFGGVITPFRPDANSFSFDQLWFEIEHPVSPEHRAGFRADIAFGKSADILSDFGQDGLSGSDFDLEIYQAYVQWLAPVPVLGDVNLQFGKWGTLIGAETVRDIDRSHITVSNVFNLLQPITHVGLMASGEFGEGWAWNVAVHNEGRPGPVDIDINDRKAVSGALGYSTDTFGVRLAGLFGPSGAVVGQETADEAIIDLIVNWNPTDKFSTYVNFDYLMTDGDDTMPAQDGDAWGVSWHGRYQITDKIAQALRFDWVADDGAVFTPFGPTTIYTVTATTEYALANNLLLRAEFRWDQAQIEGGTFNTFNNAGLLAANELDRVAADSLFFGDLSNDFASGLFTPTEQSQILVGAQVIYTF